MPKTPATAQTIDDYLAAFPPEVRQRMEALRRTIHAAAPDAVETISYRIPAFKQHGRALIYFAGYRTHIGLYPVDASDPALAAHVAPYASGKATLQFPLDQPLPLELVTRVIRAKLRPATNAPVRPRPARSRARAD